MYIPTWLLLLVVVLVVSMVSPSVWVHLAEFSGLLKQALGRGTATMRIKSNEIIETNRVKSQIAALEKQKNDALVDLGTTVCAMLDRGKIDEEALKAPRVAIARFDQLFTVKREKLVQIDVEARQALGAVQSVGFQSNVCTHCQAGIRAGAKFCNNCGTPIGVV